MKKLLLFLLLGALPALADRSPKPLGVTQAGAKEIVGAQSAQVLGALKTNDTRKLASFVSPARGLRFTPYVYPTKDDRRFSPSQVRNLARSSQKYFWGLDDASGDAINLTWPQYRQKFVWDRDYQKPTEANYNQFQQRGNTMNNLAQHYPGGIFVEYFIQPTQPEKELNWGGLWLVWQPSGKKWFLSGLANDRWTP